MFYYITLHYTLYSQRLLSSNMCFARLLCIASLIHSGYLYSASSSLLLLRGAPDCRTNTVSELTRRSVTVNFEWRTCQGPYLAARAGFELKVVCQYSFYFARVNVLFNVELRHRCDEVHQDVCYCMPSQKWPVGTVFAKEPICHHNTRRAAHCVWSITAARCQRLFVLYNGRALGSAELHACVSSVKRLIISPVYFQAPQR